MKFYICQTPKGPRLAGTQTDAKELDPNFKEHHVPDGKEERMAYVNGLLSMTPASNHTHLAKKTTAPAAPNDVYVPKVNPVYDTAVPIACVDLYNRIAVEEALWATDERGIKVLEAVILERRSELANREADKIISAPSRATPTPRKRTPPP